jgi:hypothetical protein
MGISYAIPFAGSAAGGALGVFLTMRPGLNGRAVKVLGAGGACGIVLAFASMATVPLVWNRLLLAFKYDPEKDRFQMRATLINSGFALVTASVSAIAVTALLKRAELPISYITAVSVGVLSVIGGIGGIWLMPEINPDQ